MMEARELKIDLISQDVAQPSQEEQRLNAIKKILVGNQVERLENRFRGLSRKVDSTNGQLVNTVGELNQEFKNLKAEMLLRQTGGSEVSVDLQKNIQDLINANKGTTLEDPSLCVKLETRINNLEQDILKGNTLSEESNSHLSAMSEDIQVFKEKLLHTQSRLTKLDASSNPEIKKKVDSRLSILEDKIKALNPKKIEAKLDQKFSSRQNEFEDGVQDLIERLAGRVNERFEFAGNSRKSINDQQNKIIAKTQEIEASQNELGAAYNSLSKELVNQKVEQNQVASKLTNFNKELVQAKADQNQLVSTTEALFENQKSLSSKQNSLTDEQQDLKGRMDNIQQILENDIMNILAKVNANGAPLAKEEIQKVASDMERKIFENNVRLEAKMEAMYDMTQRQLQGQHAPQADPKMKAIKETLLQLTQLLDE